MKPHRFIAIFLIVIEYSLYLNKLGIVECWILTYFNYPIFLIFFSSPFHVFGSSSLNHKDSNLKDKKYFNPKLFPVSHWKVIPRWLSSYGYQLQIHECCPDTWLAWSIWYILQTTVKRQQSFRNLKQIYTRKYEIFCKFCWFYHNQTTLIIKL